MALGYVAVGMGLSQALAIVTGTASGSLSTESSRVEEGSGDACLEPSPQKEHPRPIPVQPVPTASTVAGAVEAVPRILDCDGGKMSVANLPHNSERELWVVSVYQPENRRSGGHPMGEASVVVDGPGRHVVALSSYEPVTWTVHTTNGAQVEEVLLNGYHEQRVKGVPGQRIRRLDAPTSCSRSWPAKEGCETNTLVAAAEAATGQSMTHFAGCYSASQFHHSESSY